MGVCPEFCLYHLMELRPGEETASVIESRSNTSVAVASTTESTATTPLFRWRAEQIGKERQQSERDQPSEPATPHETGEAQAAVITIPRTKSITNLQLSPGQPTLNEVASVLRSKNSGPFEITFDVMFENESVYRILKESQILSSKLIEDIFALKPEEVLWCGWFDQARAWKATIPRKRHGISMAGGGFMENDIHGSQQYIPLANVQIPAEVSARLRGSDVETRHVL